MAQRKAVFSVQGSSSEPYTVTINFDPFSISCTCRTASSGFPCKHRKQIISGNCKNIINPPANHEEILAFVKDIVLGSSILQVLDGFETAKNEEKANDTACHNALKKYRAELTKFALHKEKSNKKSVKAKAELDKAIENGIEIAAMKENILNNLRTVFIYP